LPNIEEG
jgi:hypothetical protein